MSKGIVLEKDLRQDQWADLQRANAADMLKEATGKEIDPADIEITELGPKGVVLDFGGVLQKLGLRPPQPN